MGSVYAELESIEGFERELMLVSEQDREDAVQSAWIAWHIADESDKRRAAIQALNTYAKSEKRYRSRQTASELIDTDSTSAGIEKRISQRNPAAPRQSNSKPANAA